MKRSLDLNSFQQSPPQGDKRKCHEKKLCTPFCDPEGCSNSGKHDTWIMSLVNTQESNQLNLSDWQESVAEAKESFDFNQPLVDPVFDTESFSMLSWAAMLGKVKIVKWLLEQKFIILDTENNGNVGSNSTALFSAVRHLHIGVKTRETFHIGKCFERILDEFLKRDSGVLLVQEGKANKITLLHLCAEGDEKSNAPFLVYLKRILAKLHDLKKKNHYSEDKLRDFLNKKNCRGDTFLHLLGKYNRRQEAGEVTKLVIEKFDGIIDVTTMKNDEGKTLDDVLEDTKHEPIDVASTRVAECPPTLFPAPEPDGMLQSYGGNDENHIQDSQSVNSNQANPVESMNSSTNPEIKEAKEEVKESVRKLIRTSTLELDQEKGKLEELTRSLARCRSNIEELEGGLAEYNNFLSQL